MGAKSGEVATVSLPEVTVFTLELPVELEAELPQPAKTDISIIAARIRDTIFFIFIFSFALG